MMSLNKIRAILKKAGYKPEKRETTMVKGYRPVIQAGYRLKERKEQNPSWYGFRKINPPRWMKTGIFEVSHTDSKNLLAMLEAIKTAGLKAEIDGEWIVTEGE